MYNSCFLLHCKDFLSYISCLVPLSFFFTNILSSRFSTVCSGNLDSWYSTRIETPRKWVEAKHIWRKENFAPLPFLILSQSTPIFHELGNRSLGNCLYVRNNQNEGEEEGKENKSKNSRTNGLTY